jgi:hypothetical protein
VRSVHSAERKARTEGVILSVARKARIEAHTLRYLVPYSAARKRHGGIYWL